MMMLSDDERRQLIVIETGIRTSDPKFADGLATGHPRPPREYRRRHVMAAAAVLAVAAFMILLGMPYAIFGVVAGLTIIGRALRF